MENEFKIDEKSCKACFGDRLTPIPTKCYRCDGSYSFQEVIEEIS